MKHDKIDIRQQNLIITDVRMHIELECESISGCHDYIDPLDRSVEPIKFTSREKRFIKKRLKTITNLWLKDNGVI